jgi:hypothetical protein
MTLFPERRCAVVASDASVVQLRLSDMPLCRPRRWGACWLAGQLWQALELETGSGPIGCHRAAKGHNGTRCCRCWSRTG